MHIYPHPLAKGSSKEKKRNQWAQGFKLWEVRQRELQLYQHAEANGHKA